MDKKIKKTQTELSQEELEFLDVLVLSDLVYETVISQLNIPKEDEFYRNLMVGVLKHQTSDHIVFSIWNNLSEKQAEHLTEYIGQMSVMFPELKSDDILMEFAKMYPDLMEKINESLSKFFKDFIDLFNKIEGA